MRMTDSSDFIPRRILSHNRASHEKKKEMQLDQTSSDLPKALVFKIPQNNKKRIFISKAH